MRLRINQTTLVGAAIVAVVALIVLANTLYVVDQTQQAVVLQFGKPARVVNAPPNNYPGLKVKIPFVENVVKFDKRSIAYEPSGEEILASNQERLVVDAFLRYRIVDPLKFFTAVNSRSNAEDRLRSLVNSSLREALGSATTEQIISTDRAKIMQAVRDDVERRVSASNFGVQIVDLRIKRADLPDANAQAVYTRMQTQRQQEAKEIKARGDQQAQEIRANGQRQAETTRGEGDAERARILADAFGKDASFASFYLSMRAYEAAMAQPDTTLVLSPDSDFFRYFKEGPGG